jgi:hypothetical protein
VKPWHIIAVITLSYGFLGLAVVIVIHDIRHQPNALTAIWILIGLWNISLIYRGNKALARARPQRNAQP